MAPARKKSVNKRLLSEVSPDKEVRNSCKNKERATGRGKLSKLGPQWSKGELQRFYRAYREYGKDWKKVAAEVCNRSAEMVEAIYHMNQAYLSLPDGTASVLGLIAMMTDHYSCMEASDSEQEINDALEVSRKSLKRKREKFQINASKEEKLMPHSGGSIDGCLALLKRGRFDGDRPRAVGKRTPRIPVKKDDGENFVSPKKGRKLEVDSYDDEGVHVAALALAHASQRRGSPQVFQAPRGTSEHIKCSAVRSSDRLVCDDSVRKDWSEGVVGSKRPGISSQYKDTSSLMEMDCIGTAKVRRKGKKLSANKVKVEEIGNSYSDDGGEACSDTERLKVGLLKREVDSEVSNAKIDDTYPCRQTNKKIFPEDDISGLNPLQTLAHISLLESESSIKLSEETIQNVEGKSRAPEVYTRPRGLMKLLKEHKKLNRAVSGGEDMSSRKSKLGTPKSVSEVKQRSQSINNNLTKRKNEPVVSKELNSGEVSVDSHRSKDVSTEEDKNASVVKSKQASQVSTPSKQRKSIRSPDSAFQAGHKHAASDLAEPIAQVPVASQVIMETRKVNRRKVSLKRALKSKEQTFSGNLKNDTVISSISLHKGLLQSNEKLSSCLSSSMVRRWCMFEWFYSAIDYPWFAKREFVEYLTHVGLGHIPRLTRVEWGVIRSSLGKPRRFSDRFLLEEREKLEQYRESVRKHYSELRIGVREGLPTDLARPLTVGQRVIAVDPKTRDLYDGSVLTVDHDRCRVQFDCADIGVEFVKDIYCMPLNPLDNMPEALKRQRFSVISNELVKGHSDTEQFTSNGHLENECHPLNFAKQSQMGTTTSIPKPKAIAVDAGKSHHVTCTQPHAAPQIQAKDATMQALCELSRALDKKEVLLNEVLENQNNGDNSLKESDAFKKHIAVVLVQLKEASGQASSAVNSLQQQLNTHPANTLPPWLKPLGNSNSVADLPRHSDNSYASQESRSNVHEIVNGSRLKAQTMVDTAVKAISTMGEVDDAFVRIGEALASIDKRQLTSESKMSVTKITDHASGSLNHHNQLNTGAVEPPANGRTSEPMSLDKSGKTETAIPSELITSCVATLVMIQKCTQRQYPPADVAQIIDSAVTSLHPCCPQNLPIYREIQMCMGRIKTQILALIPT